MSSIPSYKELCDLIMASREVCISVHCSEFARARKAITKTKNEAGVEEWRYFKLKYREVIDKDGCQLCITKHRVFKSRLVLT